MVSISQAVDVHLFFSAEVFVINFSRVNFLAQFVGDLVFAGFSYLVLGGVKA